MIISLDCTRKSQIIKSITI